MTRRLRQADIRAILLLIALWLFFFWRLFTPVAADQASLAQGDFSAQFVAFAGYQYARLAQGEIPLWNPYNNGGLPFIGDPQAAVFYPPRFITIGLSQLSGGWTYNALQLEMTAHVLLASLLMYACLRRMTLRQEGSSLASLVSALIFAYGGFLTSYPPLQLAILEAAIWFPLAALGIYEATRSRDLSFGWLALAAMALGLSWLAGHPQTSYLLSALLLAYFAYRIWLGSLGWRRCLFGGLLLAMIAFGAAAVSLLPGLEYLAHTSRAAMGFAEKGNGFPIKDVAQLLLPGAFSLWSPLYVGIASLFFILLAAFRSAGDARFWLMAAAIGLLLSLGANSPFYDLAYNVLPGLRFFRGQERAAVIVACSLAIAAGIGVSAAANLRNQHHRDNALRHWRRFALFTLAFALFALGLWFGDRATYGDLLDISLRGSILALTSVAILSAFLKQPQRFATQAALLILIAIDLFSVTLNHPGTYDSRAGDDQLSISPPPLIQALIDDSVAQPPARVDGFRGLRGNFGSLYGIMDMRGISPLFLSGPQRIIQRDYVDNPLAWELFSLRYVFSAKTELSLPSTIIARGDDVDGAVHLHRLTDPRTYALLLTQADIVDSDEFALALLDDPRYDPRRKIILHAEPSLALSNQDQAGTVEIIRFAPEAIDLLIDAAGNSILSLSQPHYVGWRATLDETEVPILRAYGGLSAVEIPAGRHQLHLRYQPLSFQIGALISLLTWLGLAALAWISLKRR